MGGLPTSGDLMCSVLCVAHSISSGGGYSPDLIDFCFFLTGISHCSQCSRFFDGCSVLPMPVLLYVLLSLGVPTTINTRLRCGHGRLQPDADFKHACCLIH